MVGSVPSRGAPRAWQVRLQTVADADPSIQALVPAERAMRLTRAFGLFDISRPLLRHEFKCAVANGQLSERLAALAAEVRRYGNRQPRTS